MTKDNNLADVLLQQMQVYEETRPEIAKAYEGFVARLIEAKSGSTAPAVGDLLPRFLMPDDNGRLLSLDELLATGPLVISLNRGHWCSFCKHELDALQNINREIEELGGNIVAVTPEKQQFAKQLKIECNLDFPILCDVDNAYALLLGLAVWCGEEIKSNLINKGIDVAIYQNNSGWLLPIPATLIVSTNGKIARSYINADFRYRMDPVEVLNALRLAD